MLYFKEEKNKIIRVSVCGFLKDGFLNNKMDYSKNQNIDDPKNKIILIYNHGQDDHDDPSNNCVWKNGIRNFSSLVGEKINGKEIMLYLLCFLLQEKMPI